MIVFGLILAIAFTLTLVIAIGSTKDDKQQEMWAVGIGFGFFGALFLITPFIVVLSGNPKIVRGNARAYLDKVVYYNALKTKPYADSLQCRDSVLKYSNLLAKEVGE